MTSSVELYTITLPGYERKVFQDLVNTGLVEHHQLAVSRSPHS